ncbi:hypothetical protein PINS_up007174 [Pythium insidiosum]|nr:hypothetical protein PINS_up007174 [Pythium insidiosum]
MERFPAENQKRRKKSQADASHIDDMEDEEIELFHLVVEDLRVKSTVGWQNAVKTLNSALTHFERDESQRFLEHAFYKIVNIMLDQHSSKIGHFEKSCVTQTLMVAIPLVVAQLKSGRYSQGLPVLVMVFNKKRTFYKDLRTSAMMGNYWNKVSGAPEVRTQCIAAFAEAQGFQMLLDTLEGIVKSLSVTKDQLSSGEAVVSPAEGERGTPNDASDIMEADDIRILLQAMLEFRSSVPDAVAYRICELVMTYYVNIPESVLKRESTDAVGAVVAAIRRFIEAGGAGPASINALWLEMTLRYVESSSLPLRLFGLEQVSQIVNSARAARPFPSRYLVRNAGTQSVNGVYVLKPDANNATYVLRRDETGQVFTLFCCTMKSGLKWWFISEADKMQPGSDQDIDYYQHQSQFEEFVPPTQNWVPIGRGEAPAPELIPEPVKEDVGEMDPARLDVVLSKWVQSKQIIEAIFGDRIHREGVSRSVTLVKFLAEANMLTTSSIDVIWNSCLQKDPTLCDEIHALLIAAVPFMSDALLLHLVDEVHSSHRDRQTRGEPYPELITFLQRLAANSPSFFVERSVEVTNALLRLLWSIQVSNGSNNTRLRRNLGDFFQEGLRSAHGDSLRRIFLDECLQGIKDSCYLGKTVNGNPADTDAVASKSLELLKFLMDSYGSDLANVIETLNDDHSMVGLLFDELAAFVCRTADKASGAYRSGIGHRLDLIHYIHVKSPKLMLSVDQIERLWNTLSSCPSERECCFSFFSQPNGRGAEHQGGVAQASGSFLPVISPAFPPDVRSFIFHELLCRQTDFRSLGVMGYKCFNSFFVSMNWGCLNVEDSAIDVRELVGLDALWRIAFEAPLNVSELASVELLRVYGSSLDRAEKSDSAGNIKDFIQRIFSQLALVMNDSVDTLQRVQQCTNLLGGIVDRSLQRPQAQMQSTGGAQWSSHGRSGRGAIFEVRVIAQRIAGGAGNSLASNSAAGGNAILDNSIRTLSSTVFANQTLSQLRKHLEHVVGHPSNQCKILCSGVALTGEQKTIAELNICESSELRVLLFNSIVHRAQGTEAAAKEDEPVLVQVNPGDLIAKDSEYFDVLFRVLDIVTWRHASAHDSLWGLLKKIPTNAHLLETVTRLAKPAGKVYTEDEDTVMVSHEGDEGDDDSGRNTWMSLLQRDGSPHKAVYILQIVDALLLPSDMDSLAGAAPYRRAFATEGGFEAVLAFFLSTDVTADHFNEGAAVALRIIRFCLFGTGGAENAVSDDLAVGNENEPASTLRVRASTGDYENLAIKISELVVAECHQSGVASGSLLRNDPASVRILVDALKTIRSIVLAEPSAAERYVQSANLQALLVEVLLRCTNDQVREHWLLSLQTVVPASTNAAAAVFLRMEGALEAVESIVVPCDQLFRMLRFLVHEDGFVAQTKALALRVVYKLSAGFSAKFLASNERSGDVIIGFLEYLRDVLQHQPSLATELALPIVGVVYDNCLFTLPTADRHRCPLCLTTETRRPAFKLLATAIASSAASQVLSDLENRLAGLFHRNESLQRSWGHESNVETRGNGEHVGLKNQGCSCYMNSFLQQIFMHPTLRQGLLSAEVVPRSTPVEPTKADVALQPHLLVGCRVALECTGGRVYEASVVGYDDSTGRHSFRYDDGGEASFVLGEGRPGHENGRFIILQPELTGTEATLEVLRQVQRTFCYLRDSEMRYYNPKALVDACKCLNLEFSVYQQNDASEFCDKLLDRLETGLKSTPQGPRCLQHALAGKLISQKLPRDCGHRYEREEPFIRLELQIRGKESIEESLTSFVEGELMDGDNKVECELCGTKKAAIRRTCFGTLPNFLILHLKRFDLDYTTFETVKLNNRCSFPIMLNMKPYTKVGIEEREGAVQSADKIDKSQVEMDLSGETEQDGSDTDMEAVNSDLDLEEMTDTEPEVNHVQQTSAPERDRSSPLQSASKADEDFEYRLKGILVHSGVAQGGHYYSFIFDHVSEKWFKYDDEDVTPFDPSNIEAECFGGVQRRAWHGSANSMEMEVFSNALMLFYEKVVTTDAEYVESLMQQSNHCVYEAEVWKANEAFLQNSYLFDVEFHEFLREMIQSKYMKKMTIDGNIAVDDCVPAHNTSTLALPPPPNQAKSDYQGRALFENEMQSTLAMIGVDFVLSVLLHSREKHGIARWIGLLSDKFRDYKLACVRFFDSLATSKRSIWLQRILFESPDSIARQSFAHLMCRALASYETHLTRDGRTEEDQAILMRVLHAIIEFVDQTSVYQLTHMEECFMVIRNCADVSSTLRQGMLESDMVARLVNCFLGERAAESLKLAFPVSHRAPATGRFNSPDFQYLLEGIISILGLPRRSMEPVVHESSSHYPHRVTLSEKAERALSEVFDQYETNDSMGSNELSKFLSVCLGCSTAAPVVERKVQTILSKYGTRTSPPRVELDGFLTYYTDLGASSAKSVYHDLRAHGYGDDLRLQQPEGANVADILSGLSPLSRGALLNDVFFDSALEEDAETVCDLLLRIAVGNRTASLTLVRSLLQCVTNTETSWKGQPVVDACSQALQGLLAVENEYQSELIELALASSEFGIIKLAESREKVRQRYMNNNHVPLFIYRHIVVLLDLYAKSSGVRKWMNEHRNEWLWMYEWLRMESLCPSLGGRLAVLHRDPVKLETLCRLGEALHIPFRDEERVYVVEGAGFEKVNGLYKSTGEIHDNCAIYSCVKEDIDYTLFRCAMPSKARRWYISHSPNKSLLGTVSDEDFYFAPCQIEDDSPPELGWKVWSKNEKASPPAPTIRLHSSTVPSDQVGSTVGNMQDDLVESEDIECGDVGDMDADADTVEYEDSEDEIRVSNERFQAVHLDNQDDFVGDGLLSQGTDDLM